LALTQLWSDTAHKNTFGTPICLPLFTIDDVGAVRLNYAKVIGILFMSISFKVNALSIIPSAVAGVLC